jgi:hypothetical protein
MLLLAFLFAMRFALDSWDTVYYPLPFIFALLAWETLGAKRPPVLALSASAVVWLVFIVAPQHVSADAQSAAFLVVAVPTLLALGAAVLGPSVRLRPMRRAARTVRLPAGAPVVPS